MRACVLVVAITVLGASGCGNGGKSGVETGKAGGAGVGTMGSGNASSATGAVMSGSTTLHGRAASTLTRFVNAPIQARGVRVVAVVGKNSFWVGASKADRFLVHWQGSAATVRENDRATFTGTLEKNTGTYGVSGADTSLLEKQGVHIEANPGTLQVTR
jgi:hypothetical protein